MSSMHTLFTEKLSQHCQTSLLQFKKITRYYSLFSLLFLTVALLEILSFFLFFSFFAKSVFLGISIGIIFFTGFAYFVLLFYFQGKKPEQLTALKNHYLKNCKELLRPSTDCSFTETIYHLVNALQNQEYTYYRLPNSFKTLGPLLEKFSVWTYWKEVHQMKEMLLLEAIQENLQLVKQKPTDLAVHSSLAQAYTTLANLYQAPEKTWVPSAYFSPEMKYKFKFYIKKALEEFKIIHHFSPSNAWVHLQMASTYQALEEPQKEIKEYEILHSLLPEDHSILFQLGALYFQQGQYALGLSLYEKLKTLNAPEAEKLISYYTL